MGRNKIEEDLIAKLMKETLEHNVVAQLAHKDGRDYITPEDIGEAMKTHPEDKVRLDTLEIMADNAGFGLEDRGLCAFVAFQGKKRPGRRRRIKWKRSLKKDGRFFFLFFLTYKKKHNQWQTSINTRNLRQ